MCALFSTDSISSTPLNFSSLSIDLHAHLIPNIDDGPSNLADAIDLILNLKKLGFTSLHATPHVMMDLYPNSREKITKSFSNFVNNPEVQNTKVQLNCAAEYFIDPAFQQLIQREELLTIANQYVLVEMSAFSPSPGLNETLFDLQTKGYIPIMAHPERYTYLHKDMDLYEDLKRRGCLFQVNLLSFTGYYGRKIKKTAFKLYKEGLIDFLATDVHHMDHINRIEFYFSRSKGQEILNNYQFQNVKLLRKRNS